MFIQTFLDDRVVVLREKKNFFTLCHSVLFPLVREDPRRLTADDAYGKGTTQYL